MSILTRILSCSLVIEFTFLIAVFTSFIQNRVENGHHGTWIGTMFLSIDAYVNVYCTNLMLQKNTKQYQLIAQRVKQRWHCILHFQQQMCKCLHSSKQKKTEMDIKNLHVLQAAGPNGNGNAVNVNDQTKRVNQVALKVHHDRDLLRMQATVTDTSYRQTTIENEMTNFGVEKSEFVSQNQPSKAETLISSPV